MLPIWRDDSKLSATIRHILDILINAINQVNPNQTAVIRLEQLF